jgi:hypothetical protein
MCKVIYRTVSTCVNIILTNPVIQNLVYFKCAIERRSQSIILHSNGDKQKRMDQWHNNTGRTKPKDWQRNLPEYHFVQHKLHVDFCWSEQGS